MINESPEPPARRPRVRYWNGNQLLTKDKMRDSDNNGMSVRPSIDDVLKEVSEESGISRQQILGPNRIRKISKARKRLFHMAQERAGAPLSMLGRLTGRSHVAVKMAVDETKDRQLDK